MGETSNRIEDWLYTVCESPKTIPQYQWSWRTFREFCLSRNKDPNNIVDDYRAIKYAGEYQREEFLEKWQDIIRAYAPYLKPKLAPLSVKDCLATVKSFMTYWKIPLDVDLPKHACVIYHNRDLKKEVFKQILTFASARDKVIYLLLGESGMRVANVVNLKYWQIKEDFEAKRVPMKILLPSSELKDHVGDRWTFIGEDGFNALSDYLAGRTLNEDEYIFKSEKKGLVSGEQFSPASISVKFNRIVQKLEIAPSLGKAGKPKRIRLHGLRNYFRNNMNADSAFKKFWMGHSLGVDAHYISRDPEQHRKIYAEGYKDLRIYGASKESMANLYEMIHEKDQKLKEQESKIKQLEENFIDKLKQRDTEIASLYVHLEGVEKSLKLLTDRYENKPEFPLIPMENEFKTESDKFWDFLHTKSDSLTKIRLAEEKKLEKELDEIALTHLKKKGYKLIEEPETNDKKEE